MHLHMPHQDIQASHGQGYVQNLTLPFHFNHGTGPKAGRRPAHLWLASNPGKRWTEVFFLIYSPFWIAWALCILVPFQLYEVTPGTHMSLHRPGAWDISLCPALLEG